jgi:hypothetical protein
MGELARKTSFEESADSIFADVVNAPHPFPLPRLIARYYLGAIPEPQFLEQWNVLLPGDKYYLYHIARKAIMDREMPVARIYLNEFKQYLAPSSWRYMQIYQILNNLDRW